MCCYTVNCYLHCHSGLYKRTNWSKGGHGHLSICIQYDCCFFLKIVAEDAGIMPMFGRVNGCGGCSFVGLLMCIL